MSTRNRLQEAQIDSLEKEGKVLNEELLKEKESARSLREELRAAREETAATNQHEAQEVKSLRQTS